MEDKFESLGSISDRALQLIIFHTRDIYKLGKITAEVHYESEPKKVVLRVYDESGRELLFKPKSSIILKQLVEYLSIHDYVIEFAREYSTTEENSSIGLRHGEQQPQGL